MLSSVRLVFPSHIVKLSSHHPLSPATMAPIPAIPPPAPTTGVAFIVQHLTRVLGSPYVFWAVAALLTILVLALIGGLVYVLVRRYTSTKNKKAKQSLLPTTVADPSALRPLVLPLAIMEEQSSLTAPSASPLADEKTSPLENVEAGKSTPATTPVEVKTLQALAELPRAAVRGRRDGWLGGCEQRVDLASAFLPLSFMRSDQVSRQRPAPTALVRVPHCGLVSSLHSSARARRSFFRQSNPQSKTHRSRKKSKSKKSLRG